MSAPTIVDHDRAFDPLEPKGAAELYRRLEAAEPRRVARTELEGQLGLTARELYEIGCTPEPLELGSALAWRAAIVIGTLLASVCGAVAVAAGLDAIGVPRPERVGIEVGAVCAAFAAGGLALMSLGIRMLRQETAERRRTTPHAARAPSDDPHGRATVSVLRGPGLLRVQLLWIRGDARDPAYARSARSRSGAFRRTTRAERRTRSRRCPRSRCEPTTPTLCVTRAAWARSGCVAGGGDGPAIA